MPIRVGFATSVCPGWSSGDVAEQAAVLGFHGVELAGPPGQPHLPLAAGFNSADGAASVRNLFVEKKIELVGIVSGHSLEAKRQSPAETALQRNLENVELAARLGCRFVRVPIGRPRRGELLDAVLARLVRQFSALVDAASAQGVAILVSNTPEMPDSRSLWFVVDGVAHPALQAAWNPVLGLAARETTSISIPRLAGCLRTVQVADAVFGPDGQFQNYCPIGQGGVDYPLTIDWLKGTLFDGYLMLDWPKATAPTLPEPQEALPPARQLLVDRIKHTAPVLTAYKGDKHAPNWGSAPKAYIERC